MASHVVQPKSAAQPGEKQGGEQSMDDIVSNIRRILHGGEPSGQPPESSARTDAPEVLILEPSMMVSPDETALQPPAAEAGLPKTAAAPPSAAPTLVAPETAAAAASSLHGLVRTLVAERSAAVSRSGPTLEDLVREELRPLLKAWLDEHLPTLVDRAVRAELDRVIGRAQT